MNNNGHVELIEQTSISNILDIEIKKQRQMKSQREFLMDGHLSRKGSMRIGMKLRLVVDGYTFK